MLFYLISIRGSIPSTYVNDWNPWTLGRTTMHCTEPDWVHYWSRFNSSRKFNCHTLAPAPHRLGWCWPEWLRSWLLRIEPRPTRHSCPSTLLGGLLCSVQVSTIPMQIGPPCATWSEWQLPICNHIEFIPRPANILMHNTKDFFGIETLHLAIEESSNRLSQQGMWTISCYCWQFNHCNSHQKPIPTLISVLPEPNARLIRSGPFCDRATFVVLRGCRCRVRNMSILEKCCGVPGRDRVRWTHFQLLGISTKFRGDDWVLRTMRKFNRIQSYSNISFVLAKQ